MIKWHPLFILVNVRSILPQMRLQGFDVALRDFHVHLDMPIIHLSEANVSIFCVEALASKAMLCAHWVHQYVGVLLVQVVHSQQVVTVHFTTRGALPSCQLLILQDLVSSAVLCQSTFFHEVDELVLFSDGLVSSGNVGGTIFLL